MGKLTSKGKYTINVGNHPHTNMISKPVIGRGGEYKCRILEMHLKLRAQQLKTIMYIYRLLHQNLMATTNQKSKIDTHPHKRERNLNILLKVVIEIAREESKRRRNKKEL